MTCCQHPEVARKQRRNLGFGLALSTVVFSFYTAVSGTYVTQNVQRNASDTAHFLQVDLRLKNIHRPANLGGKAASSNVIKSQK